MTTPLRVRLPPRRARQPTAHGMTTPSPGGPSPPSPPSPVCKPWPGDTDRTFSTRVPPPLLIEDPKGSRDPPPNPQPTSSSPTTDINPHRCQPRHRPANANRTSPFFHPTPPTNSPHSETPSSAHIPMDILTPICPYAEPIYQVYGPGNFQSLPAPNLMIQWLTFIPAYMFEFLSQYQKWHCAHLKMFVSQSDIRNNISFMHYRA